MSRGPLDAPASDEATCLGGLRPSCRDPMFFPLQTHFFPVINALQAYLWFLVPKPHVIM